MKGNLIEIINRFTNIYPVDVEKLALAMGVSVKYVNLDDNISGMIEHVGNDKYRIVVNSNHHTTRQRFTIAHEIGHLVLHKHKIGTGISEDKKYRSTKNKYYNTAIGRFEETQANRIAASILMPGKLIRKLKEEGITTPKEMAEKLGVSEIAMCIRMGQPYQK